MNTKQIALIILLLVSAMQSQACIHNGIQYPEGTILGPYICSGGTWVPR